MSFHAPYEKGQVRRERGGLKYYSHNILTCPTTKLILFIKTAFVSLYLLWQLSNLNRRFNVYSICKSRVCVLNEIWDVIGSVSEDFFRTSFFFFFFFFFGGGGGSKYYST